MSRPWASPLRNYDDPFTSPPHPPRDNTFRWASRVVLPSTSARFSRFRISPVRVSVLLVTVAFVVFIRDHLPWNVYTEYRMRPIKSTFNFTSAALFPFDSIENVLSRANDRIDTFETYKFRSTCNISSLDLHIPFTPLCPDRESMLKAMSSGGRIGNDAPYIPRYCDMRWFTTEEICEILGRFERVVLVGDSMLRHVIGSINILIRKDLGYGAVTDWNFSAQEKKECFCNEQFDVKACSVQGIYKTADVLAHDPKSVACSSDINLFMEQINRFPIPPEEIERLISTTGALSKKPKAFIFGHGLWNNLDLQKTVNWMDVILNTIKNTTGSNWQGLFLTPNAAGKEKPDDWIVTQGNKALMLFEEAVGIEAGKRGLEHLGTWNMSIQSNKYDGVHLDMKGNLVKAMMVLNWLNLL